VDFAPSPTEAESDSERRYIIRYQEGGEVKEFLAERVVMATGLNQVPFVPKIEGIERFGGEVLHSRSFRE
jgi:cation diffusion facilitator CzcD-associated flavoprotein CzcO